MPKLKAGDLAIQDSKMPYPNAIYRVLEVDDHGNFRGEPVFRLAIDFPRVKSQWLGFNSFRRVTAEELCTFQDTLANLRYTFR